MQELRQLYGVRSGPFLSHVLIDQSGPSKVIGELSVSNWILVPICSLIVMSGVVSETWVAHALVESAEKFGDTLQAGRGWSW